MDYLTEERIQSFIQLALDEDIGPGDYTSLASIPEAKHVTATMIAKGGGVAAGMELGKLIYHTLDPDLHIDFKKDGESFTSGDELMRISGKARAIMSGERVVLNCIQHMSGIATKTYHIVRLLAPFSTKLLDTRKTTPTIRFLEKWAVKIGGGMNHRYALYDMIMLKDNHIDAAGGIGQALKRTRQYLKKNKLWLKIEVEARSIDEVKEILSVGGVDMIMLDNMSVELIKEAVNLIGGQAATEASGGIDESMVVAIAETGVNFISMGALTHSVKSIDLSLRMAGSERID